MKYYALTLFYTYYALEVYERCNGSDPQAQLIKYIVFCVAVAVFFAVRGLLLVVNGSRVSPDGGPSIGGVFAFLALKSLLHFALLVLARCAIGDRTKATGIINNWPASRWFKI